MDERLRAAPVGVLTVSPGGTVTGLNQAARELLATEEDADVTGADVSSVAPRSVDDSLLAAIAGASVDETAFEEYYPDIERWLAVTVVPGEETGEREDSDGREPAPGDTTVYLRDVTARRRHERTVERLRAERERTALIDDVRAELLAELLEASDRAEVVETLCAGLGEPSVYEFAVVVEPPVGEEAPVVGAAAGRTGETLPAVREALAGPEPTPEQRAIETGTVRAVPSLAAAEDVPEGIRRAGFADGVQSVLAVPLAHGADVHGALGVYAGGEDAISERERTALETLGEVAGFAVRAARNRSLLLADTVTEVTLALDPDHGAGLGALADRLGAAVGLDGLVPHDEETIRCFVSLTAGPDTVESTLEETTGLSHGRVVSETDGGTRAEVEVRAPDPLVAVATRGGSVRTARFDEEGGRLVVELPPDGAVRRVVETLRREFGAEVVAKRDRAREVTTERAVADALDERLTDRQAEVLRAAHLAGYFESPRASTAEEVAGSLGITGPTLLHHLRAAQRTLLDAVLDSGQGRDP